MLFDYYICEGSIRYCLYFKLRQIAMFFEEDDQSLPLSQQPSLPDLPEEQTATIANYKTIKFQTLVNFFNRHSNMRGVKKTNYVKEFIKLLFKSNRSPEFTYPVIRLILPADDRERGNYGLKQKNLSKVIAESLNITKEDYLRLHHFKNPSFHKNGIGIGDFSLCAFDVIKSYCKEVSTLTIHELNGMLDQLIASSNNQIPIFRKLFTISNAEQIKWIIRIILKDLKVSIKIDTILNTFHKDASDYYNLTNSLLETCKKFENPYVSLDDQIKIFFPIRPMLAGKKKIGFFRENQHKVYYVETKYDGQRLQAHKCKDNIKLFSRNAIDYTKLYQQFVQVINDLVIAEQCIFDGQIIVIEKETHKMTPFGMNKMVALNKDTDQYQLCFMIFDVLWLKEENEEINLMKYPLRQRKEILNKIVKEKPGILQIVKYQQIDQYDQIVKRFSESIDRSQQGIMVKDPNSLYIPKERGSSWTKLKGDYVDGLTDTLDLIILGGYYGDSSARHGNSMHWTDQITSFLLGIIESIDPLNPKIAYAVPFAKVGTGYSFEQLGILRQKLKDNFMKFDPKQKPSYLLCNWKPFLQDKPDCWIRTLNKSIVLQIKAAQMIASESYPSRFTLRFPRVVKIRYDKDWSEAQTVKDIEQLSNNTLYNKNLKRKLDDSDSDKQKQLDREREIVDERTKKRKKNKEDRKQGVYQEYLSYNMENQKLVSHLFSKFQFCVFHLQNQRYRKSQIERQIMLHDGIVVQNPMFSTQYIVTDTIDFKLRAFQTQKNKKYTFIKPIYIMNCVKANKILPLSPLYLTVLPQGNAQFYRDNFDRFGDSYTNYLDLRQLDVLLQSMNGQYVINDKLDNYVSLKYRRSGRISYGYNLTELQKVKLRMHGNAFVGSLYQQPNSIIVNGYLDPKFAKEINEYKRQAQNVVIEFVDDLIMAKIL